MANRPAWTIENNYIKKSSFEFEWNGGFAISQKRKNIVALHNSILEKTDKNALEISTKSELKFGQMLSAFNLKLDGHILENIFQSSKVYTEDGPFLDLLDKDPKDAKRDERHKNSGELIGFVYKNQKWDIIPETAFYDYIYISSIFQTFTVDEISELLEYDWFTDIEFNPAKSINCQARAAALLKFILINKDSSILNSHENWLEYHRAVVKN